MPKKLTLEAMQRAAAERGGRCLSQAYVGVFVPLEWECANGHRWEAMPHSVRQGHWCRQCFDERRRKPLDSLRALAARRHGMLLSSDYRNSQTAVRWRCERGHEWEAIPNSVSRGTWCPLCA